MELFEESQQPSNAHALNASREKRDTATAALGKKRNSTKLDFTAVVAAKHLHTKAAVMSHAQAFGTQTMQLFANKHQRKVDEFIEDAQEWHEARRVAHREALTDCDMLCFGLCRDRQTLLPPSFF